LLLLLHSATAPRKHQRRSEHSEKTSLKFSEEEVADRRMKSSMTRRESSARRWRVATSAPDDTFAVIHPASESL
jgi:hypothetical protein